MKWETIKTKCIRESNTRIENLYDGSLSLISLGCLLDSNSKRKYEETTLTKSNRKELSEEITKAIRNWDIRCYKQLQKVFPKAFPSKFVNLELTEKGWELF